MDISLALDGSLEKAFKCTLSGTQATCPRMLEVAGPFVKLDGVQLGMLGRAGKG